MLEARFARSPIEAQLLLTSSTTFATMVNRLPA